MVSDREENGKTGEGRHTEGILEHKNSEKKKFSKV